MPGLWARSLVGGAQEATTHWCFSPSLSPSLPFSLKINKYYFLKREENYSHIGEFVALICVPPKAACAVASFRDKCLLASLARVEIGLRDHGVDESSRILNTGPLLDTQFAKFPQFTGCWLT